MGKMTIGGINQIPTNARRTWKSEGALESYRKENGFPYYLQKIKEVNNIEKKQNIPYIHH